MSKCHIVGNLMHRLICQCSVCKFCQIEQNEENLKFQDVDVIMSNFNTPTHIKGGVDEIMSNFNTPTSIKGGIDVIMSKCNTPTNIKCDVDVKMS